MIQSDDVTRYQLQETAPDREREYNGPGFTKSNNDAGNKT